jgi:hypothetical protein
VLPMAGLAPAQKNWGCSQRRHLAGAGAQQWNASVQIALSSAFLNNIRRVDVPLVTGVSTGPGFSLSGALIRKSGLASWRH